MSSEFEIDRRSLVSAAAATLLGVRAAAPCGAFASAESPQATAKSIIYLYMDGGMSQLDTFDVKPGSDVQGPIEAIDTNVAGVHVSHHFPLTAKLMDKVALVRSMNTTQGSHRAARHFLRTSYRLDGSLQYPALGSWIARAAGRLNRSLPASVVVNPNSDYPYAGFLKSEFAALAVSKPTEGVRNLQTAEGVSQSTFDEQYELAKKLRAKFSAKFPNKQVQGFSQLYDEAVRLMNCQDVAAFDISREPQSVRQRYGDTPFGQGCLLARRLIEKEVRFVEVVKPGWDTHNFNFTQIKPLAADLDCGLSALLTDLAERGLLASTLVVVATEFGRTPEISKTNGRGHHVKAFTFFLAGGGIRGGQVHGATDGRAFEVVRDGVTIPDLNATIAHAVGVEADTSVHLEARQRDYRIAGDGTPVKALF